jgi:hypothetical protein
VAECWSKPSPATSGALHAVQRVGWQPSQFLSDRTEAERAFALAEQLGSVNAAAQGLGTTWPSLRKAFGRHGLGMPARTPEAVRRRAIAAASQRGGPPTAPPLDPVFVTLNRGQLPTRRGPHAEQGVRLRRAEETETLSCRTVVELIAESRLAPQRRVVTIARRPERAQRLAAERAGRSERRQLQRLTRTDRTDRPIAQPQERGWWPMPDSRPCPKRPGPGPVPGRPAAYLNRLFLHEPAFRAVTRLTHQRGRRIAPSRLCLIVQRLPQLRGLTR